MDKKTTNNCWDYWKCPHSVKSTCQAFINKMGHECWFIGDLNNCPKDRKENNCMNCQWFLMKNPDSK